MKNLKYDLKRFIIKELLHETLQSYGVFDDFSNTHDNRFSRLYICTYPNKRIEI